MTRSFVVLAVASLLLAASCGGLTSGSGDGDQDATAPDASRSGASGSSGANSNRGGSDTDRNGSGVPSTDEAGIVFPGPTDAGANCPPGAPLSCYVSHCANGAHTTVAGKVYDPAGKVPLYNVIVFVPNDPHNLPPITLGTSSCDSCDKSIGDYVSVTTTDKGGAFTLTDVPTGMNVPLVVQIGKWRRTVTVPSVADCRTTTLPTSGTNQLRLPRNRSEGQMPQMALLTGGLDDLGCFLTRVGIDAAEYSAPHGGGRLDVYQGLGNGLTALPGSGLGGAMSGPGLSNGTAGDCTTTSCPLWASKQSLESYDLVLLACEGDTFDPDAAPDGGATFGGNRANVTKAGKQAMHDWLDEGGRLLATHFQYTWFQNGPSDFQGVANWLGSSVGSGTCNCSIDTTFPAGQTFHDWLQNVGALSGNSIALTGVAQSVAAVNAPSTRWIYDNTTSDPKYFSFDTPIGGVQVAVDAGAVPTVQYCGKAAFTDLHAGGSPSGDIPASCKQTDLNAQEKALEFLLFDLESCVNPVPTKVSPPQQPSPPSH